MRDSHHNEDSVGSDTGLHGQHPAIQVICLGNSGGPCEENVTGFLVRSIASDWGRASLLAVDAGSHLAPIVRILEKDFPAVSEKLRSGSNGSGPNGTISKALARASLSPSPVDDDPPKPEPTVIASGPFAGLKVPNASARANALHILRSYISTYLITHPHLDHISGFTINTAAFHATSKPKTLAALPSTVDAIKQHIFNDVIWPNLTDEDGGVGFVTFQRLKEGGDVMVGEGEGRGYIDVVDGLGVRAFKVSHGVCTKSPPSHQHRGSIAGLADNILINGEGSQPMARSTSMQFSTPGTPGVQPRQSFHLSQQPSPRMAAADGSCVVDSTAYFIRDTETAREVLIFGDVEPDSMSLSPRNRLVWQEASRKIAHGILGGIFIECSYDDSQADAVLFGHLCPRHVIAELQTLANFVVEAKATRMLEKGAKKRKRSGVNGLETVAKHAIGNTGSSNDRKRSRSLAGRRASTDIRRSSVPDTSMTDIYSTITSPQTEQSGMVDGTLPNGGTATPATAAASFNAQMSPRSSSFPVNFNPSITSQHQAPTSQQQQHQPLQRDLPKDLRAQQQHDQKLPLHGVKVIIIHVKDTFKDGPHVSERILDELREYEAGLREEGIGLGCEFVISASGESYWF
jgi:cAMP phosphodiesterase